MTAYQLLVATHGTIGVAALLTFWAAAFLRKGSPLHRRVGQGYLLAMVGIIATGAPMAAYKFAEGKPVAAVFLGYLLVITATGVWSAWRAIRDKHDVARYTGPVYRGFALLCLASGVGVLALGYQAGSPLLMGFSAIGLFTGQDMLRKRRNRQRLAVQPRWWLVEHYSAMLGNGIATHVAFLAIGLPRLLPAVNGTALHYFAWFGPVLVAIVAKVLVDRRYKARPPVRPATPAVAAGAGTAPAA